MHSTILYCDAVKEFLEKGEYKLGLECFSDDVTSLCVCSYWHLGRNVVLVKHQNGIIDSVKFCNSGELICSFDSSRQKLIHAIETGLKHLCDAPPSILGTFDGVLFKSYTSSVDKYDKLMQSVNQFSPEFLELFRDEINQMTLSETSVVTTVKRYQWFKDSSDYYYATDVIGNIACIKGIDGFDAQKLDFRELQNGYTMIETPAEIGQLLQMVLTGCHEIFNIQELVSILQALGYRNFEEFSRIEKPVVFDGRSSIDYTDKDEIFGKELLFKCSEFCVRMSFSAGLFLFLRHTTQGSVIGQIQSIREVIKPAVFYDMAVELVYKVLEEFNMILWDQQLLHAYLYQLLGALESVEPSKDIPYEATWDDYPVSGSAIDTAQGHLMLTEAQPTKIQF